MKAALARLAAGLVPSSLVAALTAGLVLKSVNDSDAPGYDAEKNFSRDHPVPPPDPEAFRLTELEAKHKRGGLTAEEEAGRKNE